MNNSNAAETPRARRRKKAAEPEAAASDPGLESEGLAELGGARRGALTALLVLLALGIVVATYLTVAHLELFHGVGSFKSICNFGARLSCDAVNTSDQSEVRGIGIALFAIPAYAMMAFLTIRARSAPADQARSALALAHMIAWPAVACTAYLLFVMVFTLRTLCLFCLTLDTVNVGALVLTAVAARARPWALARAANAALDEHPPRLALIASGLGAAVLGLALLGHAKLRAALEAEARAAVMVSAAADEPAESESAAPLPAGARKLPTRRWPVAIDDDDASVGPKDARVTVVQFADFQCAFCRRLEQAMAPIRRKYAGEVRFVFKHYPMNPRCNAMVHNEKHKYACDAAASGECARRQGKFWPMHDLLYERQAHLERSALDADAAEVGLDGEAFAACMNDGAARAAIRQDALEGAQVNVSSTPRTFINGRMFGGVLSEDLLDYVIRVELGRVTGQAAELYTPPPASSAPPP